MKIIREIMKVGFFNWCWFVLYLKRDEFSNKLCLLKYYPNLDKLAERRELAHKIDMALMDSRRLAHER